jgi:hypothetical protein
MEWGTRCRALGTPFRRKRFGLIYVPSSARSLAEVQRERVLQSLSMLEEGRANTGNVRIF